MLDVAFQRLLTCGCHTVSVVNACPLAGLLTIDNPGEYLLIQAPTKKGDARAAMAAAALARRRCLAYVRTANRRERLGRKQ